MKLTRLLQSVSILILVCSASLLAINVYGLTQDLRPQNLSPEFLRFGERDLLMSKEDYFTAIQRTPEESDLAYAKRLTTVIADGTAHVDWEIYDPSAFHQLVPLWENWILYIMGRFSGIDEYERYHFSSPQKSMERGIGICGDASILMSQMLEKNGIENTIITFPGHVVVAADIEDQELVFDPDFGVVIPHSVEHINQNVRDASDIYAENGYSTGEVRFFINEYVKPFSVWNGPQHLITKKFYFEKFSYVAKWVLPLLGLGLCALLLFGITKKEK